MHIDLVSLTPEDLAATGEVLKAAYNVPNSREETLRRYLALQPESFRQQRTLSHRRSVGPCNAVAAAQFMGRLVRVWVKFFAHRPAVSGVHQSPRDHRC